MAARFLKVGIVCYPSIGGSGIVASNLGNGLAALGHQSHFISYERPLRVNSASKNVFFHQVPIQEYDLFKYPDYTLPLAVKIAQVHQHHHLDLVHVHYAIPHATAALLASDMMRLCNVRPPNIVTTLHGTDITLIGKDPAILPVVRYSIERSCCVTAVSEYLKRETVKILKTKTPIEVIYNFYTPNKPAASREAVRAQLGLGVDDVVAVHASNLRPVKRVPDLLAIMALLKRQRRLKLLILAGGDFAPFRPMLRRLRIEDKVVVAERVLDIDTYLNAADIGLYTSENETFGMGMLESMSHGLPVVASRVGGVPEVVEHGKQGLLCRVGAIEQFAHAVELLIADPQRRKELGANAQLRARNDFSAEKGVAHYLCYYRSVLGK